jgi:UDP-2,3-diacylglucosamine pyrophosphatase LpxH
VAGKLKIVLSDFHLGAGSPAIGDNPLEDFVADKAFSRFLETMRSECDGGATEIELIINGDFFEFLQVPAVDEFDPQFSYPVEAYQDSSQAASIKRLDLITAGHPIVFDALSDFIQVEAPQRRVTIIKGNHDVNLFWPGVKQRLREILGATGRRASMLLFAEHYVSREGIYVEHGHQYAEQFNRWDNFDEPRDRRRSGQIVYPPGSRFVIDFLNSVERERAWADGIKPLTALAWYSLEWDFFFAVRMLLALAKHIPTTKASDRAAKEAIETLCYQLRDATFCQVLADRYTTSLDFRRHFHTRVAQLLVPAASPPGMFVWPAPPADESATEIARQEIEEIQASMRRVASRVIVAENAHVVVFGHTHRPGLELLENGGTLVNCGSWLWLGGRDPADVEDWREFFAHSDQLTLHHHLTYARIDYDEQDVPHAQLLAFVEQQPPVVPDEPLAVWPRVVSYLRRMLDKQQ